MEKGRSDRIIGMLLVFISEDWERCCFLHL